MAPAEHPRGGGSNNTHPQSYQFSDYEKQKREIAPGSRFATLLQCGWAALLRFGFVHVGLSKVPGRFVAGLHFSHRRTFRALPNHNNNQMDAAGWKAKGNEAFSAKNFPEAIECFSKAIELDASNHVLYSNRSASYASLNKYEEALTDAEKCVSLNPQWAKGYIRLGAAQHGLENFDAAVATYNKGLEIEPENATLKQSLESVNADRRAAAGAGQQNPFAKMFGPGTMDKIRANPQLAAYLAQPDYVQMVNTVCANPQMMNMYMQDKRMMHTMLALSGIDMNDLGKGDAEGPAAQRAAQPEPAREAPKPKPAAKPAAATANLTPAQKIKEEGNAHYKKREFAEAMAKYKEAAELEPTNTTFLLNQTAVLFEEAKYDECIQACEAAIDHGRENKADFSVIAKLMTRIASCLQKQKKYDEAIPLFKKALLEHRNAETLTKLQACEKEAKTAAEEAYFSVELSLKAKEEGNEHFKGQRYPDAIKCYDEAQKRNPKDHTVYSNRAAALLKLCAYEDAIRDCDKCIDIKPEFAKAYARKGHAYFFTKQYNKALSVYEEGLKVDETNQECIDGKQKTMWKIQEMASGPGDEEAAARAMQDPEIQQILQDSYMQMVLGEMQKDPKKINDYMRDPGISAKINKLIMAGVLRVGNGPQGGQQQPGRR